MGGKERDGAKKLQLPQEHISFGRCQNAEEAWSETQGEMMACRWQRRMHNIQSQITGEDENLQAVKEEDV